MNRLIVATAAIVVFLFSTCVYGTSIDLNEQDTLQVTQVDNVWNDKFPRIIIQTKSGPKPGQLTDIADAEKAKSFVDFIKTTLTKIYKTGGLVKGYVGKDLFKALHDTGKTIRIFLKDSAGPGTFRDPMDVQTEPLQLLKHFQPLYMMDSFDFESDVRRIGRQNIYGAINPIQPQSYTSAARNFDSILRRYIANKKVTSSSTKAFDLSTVSLTSKDAKKKLDELAKKTGLTAQQLQDIVSTKFVATPEQYWKLVFELYPFMESGGGCDALVGMSQTEQFEATTGTYNPKKNFEDAPAYIVLAHELIHALHIASGRRIVRSGWEEEALTSGLEPFDKLEKLNENAFRVAAGLPKRKYYGMNGNRAWQSAYTIGIYCGTVPEKQRDLCNARKQTLEQAEATDKYTTVEDAKKTLDEILDRLNMKVVVMKKRDDFSVFRALCEAGFKHATHYDKLEPIMFANNTVCNSADGYKIACQSVVDFASEFSTAEPFPTERCNSLDGWTSSTAEDAIKNMEKLIAGKKHNLPLKIHMIDYQHHHLYGTDNLKACSTGKLLCIARNYEAKKTWAAVVPK